jgi:hypothetical protein
MICKIDLVAKASNSNSTTVMGTVIAIATFTAISNRIMKAVLIDGPN